MQKSLELEKNVAARKSFNSSIEKNPALLYEIKLMNIKFFLTFVVFLAFHSSAFSLTISPEMGKAESDNYLALILGFLAVVVGTLNVVGGFVVTDRMLEMFKKKKK